MKVAVECRLTFKAWIFPPCSIWRLNPRLWSADPFFRARRTIFHSIGQGGEGERYDGDDDDDGGYNDDGDCDCYDDNDGDMRMLMVMVMVVTVIITFCL